MKVNEAHPPPLDRLVGINDLPIVINSWLRLRGGKRVTTEAARQWWLRSRGRYGFDDSGVQFPYLISPLPAPVIVGIIQERPMWAVWKIVEWYADWKGIVKLPDGVVERRAESEDGVVVVEVAEMVELVDG
jgi:hypothetical protein